MPQMSPYNWLILFLMFNSMMIFYCSYNNFIFLPLIKNFKNKKMISFSWKW